MTIATALAALDRLAGTQAPEDFYHALSWLEAALDSAQDAWLDELHQAVAQAENPSLAVAFDACLDLLCAEASDSVRESVATEDAHWKCLALNLVIKKPTQHDLVRFNDVTPMHAWLSRALALPATAIKVDPLLIPTATAFEWGPLAAHRRCQLAKSRATGVHFAFLDAVHDSTAAPHSESLHLCEGMVLVTINTAEETLDLLQRLKAHLQARTMWSCQSAGQPLTVQALDIATPWAGFTQFLHDAPALTFMARARAALKVAGLPVGRASWHSALVQYADGSTSTRTSVLAPDGALLLGVSEERLHYPALYQHKISRMLEAAGQHPLDQWPETYDASEVDAAGSAGFPGPADTWHYCALPKF